MSRNRAADAFELDADGALSGRVRVARPTLLQKLLFWFILLVTFGTMLSYGANRPAPLTILISTALGTALIFLLTSRRFGDAKVTWSLVAPGTLYFLAMAWAAYQSGLFNFETGVPTSIETISLDPDATFAAIAAMCGYAACFWIGAEVGRSRTEARRMIDAVALFGGALSIFGIAAHLTGMNPLAAEVPDVSTSRLTASFANPNSFAFVAATAALASLTAIDQRLSDELGAMGRIKDLVRAIWGGSWIFGLIFLVCLFALLLSGSRGGVLATVVAFVAYFALRNRHRSRDRSKTLLRVKVALGAGAVGIVMFLGANYLLNRFFQEDQIDNVRLQIYSTTVDAIFANPFSGIGLGAYKEGIKPFLHGELATSTWSKAHNTYLELMLEFGIPGFLLWFSAMALVFSRIILAATRKRSKKAIVAFSFSVFIVAAIHSIVDFPLQMPANAALFSIITGMGWAQSLSTTSRMSQ